VLQVGRELLAELGGVLGIQVDLIVGAVEGEPHGLLRRAAGQIVFQDDGYFLGHLNLSTAMVPAPCPGWGPPAVSECRSSGMEL
jgi:hypothetical protein